MKHIYIFNEESIAGNYGVGSYIRELANSLKDSFKVHIVTLFSIKETELCTRIENDITYLYFPVFNDLHSLKKDGFYINYYKSIARILRVYIDPNQQVIFQFNYNKGEILVDMLKTYFPSAITYLTIHSMSWCFMLKGNANLFRDIINRYNAEEQIDISKQPVIDSFEKERALFMKMDRIICLSSITYNILTTVYNIDITKIVVIPNGLEDKFIHVSQDEKLMLRKRFNINDHDKVFVSVGRIEKNKGTLYLVEAFKEVIKHFPDCLLFIIGDGDAYYKECLKKSYPFFKNILFTGRLKQTDLYDFYRMADIGIISSLHEQCSYVAIEMMMFGLSIISTNGYGFEEMFVDKYNACLVDIPQKEELFIQNIASVILEFLSSCKYQNLQINARKVYKEYYQLAYMKEKSKKEFTSFLLRK